MNKKPFLLTEFAMKPVKFEKNLKKLYWIKNQNGIFCCFLLSDGLLESSVFKDSTTGCI